MLRRSFLKLGTILSAAGLPLISLAETQSVIAPSHRDWIQDCNDYYIIRIPDQKVFTRESIDKPAIIVMGQYSRITDCEFYGYINLYAGNGHQYGINNCMFDTSKYAKLDRATIEFCSISAARFDAIDVRT